MFGDSSFNSRGRPLNPPPHASHSPGIRSPGRHFRWPPEPAVQRADLPALEAAPFLVDKLPAIRLVSLPAFEANEPVFFNQIGVVAADVPGPDAGFGNGRIHFR